MVFYVAGAHCDQVPESMNISYGTDVCFNGDGVCWWRSNQEWDSRSAHIRWTLCTSKHCAASLQHGRLVNSALSHSLQDRQLIIGHHCCLATHRTNLLSWCSCSTDGQETHSGHKVYVTPDALRVCLSVCVHTTLRNYSKPCGVRACCRFTAETKVWVWRKAFCPPQVGIGAEMHWLTSLFLKICVLCISTTWGQIVNMTKMVKIFRLFKLPVPLEVQSSLDPLAG